MENNIINKCAILILFSFFYGINTNYLSFYNEPESSFPKLKYNKTLSGFADDLSLSTGHTNYTNEFLYFYGMFDGKSFTDQSVSLHYLVPYSFINTNPFTLEFVGSYNISKPDQTDDNESNALLEDLVKKGYSTTFNIHINTMDLSTSGYGNEFLGFYYGLTKEIYNWDGVEIQNWNGDIIKYKENLHYWSVGVYYVNNNSDHVGQRRHILSINYSESSNDKEIIWYDQEGNEEIADQFGYSMWEMGYGTSLGGFLNSFGLIPFISTNINYYISVAWLTDNDDPSYNYDYDSGYDYDYNDYYSNLYDTTFQFKIRFMYNI